MNFVDLEYAAIIKRCLAGKRLTTRNAECHRTRNAMVTFDSTPLVSARRTAWRNCLREWEWFMSGSCSIAHLHESVRTWWEPWADDRGFVPNNYSNQLRGFTGKYNTVDQVQYLIDCVKDHPNSRRAVITTWNTADMIHHSTPITNCHGTVIQAFVEDGLLHLTTYQRSCDVVCGLPHNWLQYWAFVQWLAHRSGRGVGSLTWVGGDVHVYAEHEELAKDIVMAADVAERTPRLVYTPTSEDFKAEDFSLDGEYKPILTDKAKMIV